MKRKYLNAGALTAPLPPAMVTVGDMENSNVLTVAWTGILSTVPPKTYISVRPSRHSYGMLCECGEFVIHLASADMSKTVDYVGIYTGKKVNKFEKCSLTKIPSKWVKAPTIAECPLSLECRVTDILKMGSHDVFIADILGVSCREELMDDEGRLHIERGDLLAYAHGEYYSLGERLGRFGFSTDKKSTKSKAVAKGAQKKSSLKKTDCDTESTATKKGSAHAENKNTQTPKGEGSLQNKHEKAAERDKREHSGRENPFYMGLPRSVLQKSARGGSARRGADKGGKKKK